jgi:predicted transcriptional regulator
MISLCSQLTFSRITTETISDVAMAPRMWSHSPSFSSPPPTNLTITLNSNQTTVRVSPGDDDHGVFQRFVHPSRKERMAILTRKHCVV